MTKRPTRVHKGPQCSKNGPQGIVDPPQGSTRHYQPPTRLHKAWKVIIKGSQCSINYPQGLTRYLPGKRTLHKAGPVPDSSFCCSTCSSCFYCCSAGCGEVAWGTLDGELVRAGQFEIHESEFRFKTFWKILNLPINFFNWLNLRIPLWILNPL